CRLVAVAVRSAPEPRSAPSATSVAHGEGKLKLIGTRAAHSHRPRNATREAARRAMTIVYFLPTSLSTASSGAVSKNCSGFHLLTGAVRLPVATWNERFSTAPGPFI